MKTKTFLITSSIILVILALSYLALINSVEEPFEEQGIEKATITGETILGETILEEPIDIKRLGLYG